MIKLGKRRFILTMTFCNGLNEVRNIRFCSPDLAKKSAMRWYRSCPLATAIRVQFDDGQEVINLVKKGGVK